MSFILGRPDHLKPAMDVLLEAIYANFESFAAHFPSACAFAAKIIELLSGHIAFEEFVLKFANILIDLQLSQTVDAHYCSVIYSIQAETFTTAQDDAKTKFMFNQFLLAMHTQNLEEAALLDKKISAADCSKYLDRDSGIKCLNAKVALRMKKQSDIAGCSLLFESLYEITKNWDFIVLCCYVNLARGSDSERVDAIQTLLHKHNFPESHAIFLEGISLYLSRTLIDINDLKKNLALKTGVAAELGLSQTVIDELWSDAVLDHNILLLSKCYQDMYLEKLARLCFSDTKYVFDRICKLVNCDHLSASINAKDGTIKFKGHSGPVLSQPGTTIKTCSHLVRKKLTASV